MKALLKCLVLATCAATASAAALAEESPALRLKPKALSMAGSVAPYHAESITELPLANPYAGMEREPVPGSCAVSSSSVCYDYRSGRAVFKASREWMPEVNGLQRESISLKRDKLTFNYSFK